MRRVASKRVCLPPLCAERSYVSNHGSTPVIRNCLSSRGTKLGSHLNRHISIRRYTKNTPIAHVIAVGGAVGSGVGAYYSINRFGLAVDAEEIVSDLDQETLEDIAHLFKEYDLNGDGVISIGLQQTLILLKYCIYK